MYSCIKSSLIQGIDTIPISVEVDVSTGMPVFDMVGYLASEVKEAKERVKTSLHNCGISLPAKRITVNMSPGNIRKKGTSFDLPIAVGLLCALGIIEQNKVDDYLFFGELRCRDFVGCKMNEMLLHLSFREFFECRVVL